MRFIAFLEAPAKSARSRWGVFFPDLPGCTSGGKTFEDAAANARDALSMHLAGMWEDGETISEPRTLREIVADPDFGNALLQNGGACVPQIVTANPPSRRVRVNVTIDEGLLGRVDARAASDGVTRSRMIEDALAVALEG